MQIMARYCGVIPYGNFVVTSYRILWIPSTLTDCGFFAVEILANEANPLVLMTRLDAFV